MKSLSQALRVLVAAASTAAMGSAARLLEFNHQLAHSYAADSNVTHPLIHHHNFLDQVQLLGESGFTAPACDISTDPPVSNNYQVHVLLAFSSCLLTSDLATIKTWIDAINLGGDSYFQNGHRTDIVFDSVWIQPPACPITNDASGNSRLKIFDEYGTIFRQYPNANNNPMAVISFVNDGDAGYTSLASIMTFEANRHIATNFNFMICADCNLDGPGFFVLHQAQDLFKYNPFVMSRGFHCAKALPNGVAITFADDNMVDRRCYCVCPVGTQAVAGVNGKPTCQASQDKPQAQCVWQDKVYDIAAPFTTSTCSFSQAATNNWVAVPFPFDNYVADRRLNVFAGAHVDVIYGTDASTSVTTSYQWKDYQSNPESAIDAMTFTDFGKYTIKLDAVNYYGHDDCVGCLAIYDNFRPNPTTTCPTTLTCSRRDDDDCDANKVPLFKRENRNAVKNRIDGLYKYQSKADNDACSKTRRCDDVSFTAKEFFTDEFHAGEFNGVDVAGNSPAANFVDGYVSGFFAQPRTYQNPFAGGMVNNEPDTSQCKRCLSLSVTLKERVTNYNCHGEYIVPDQCVGDHQCCYDQCLAVDGDTFATASMTIKRDVRDKSAAVIADLEKKEHTRFNPFDEVHVALDCDYLGEDTKEACDYSAVLKDLFVPSVTPKRNAPNDKQFVFWRYRIGGNYYDFDSLEAFKFTEYKTQVTFEAWTQCGQVGHGIPFDVYLHTRGKIIVCQKFDTMWYQSSINQLVKSDELCNFPHTDFVELTFDYHPNIGVEYDREELHLEITSVQCQMQVFDAILDEPVGTAAHIVDVTVDKTTSIADLKPQIVQRFPVELINNPATDSTTKIKVFCDFAYLNQITNTIESSGTCSKVFTAKSCNPPIIDLPNARNLYTDCANDALGSTPGPFEACGGPVVKYDGSNTIVEPRSTTCCSSECTAIFGLPAGKDVSYCVPKSDGKPIYFEQESKSLLAANSQSRMTAGVLLLGAMVGVALVVVARRRGDPSHSQQQQFQEEYHSLLDQDYD